MPSCTVPDPRSAAERTGAILLRRNPPHGPEPQSQGLARILEDRTGGHRGLIAARCADQAIPGGGSGRPGFAAWANESIRPA